jgi:PadR family transcriptional regulator, regulatory protein AphA
VVSDQRERILAATVGLIYEQGYSRLTVAQITALARISRNVFYAQIKNKQQAAGEAHVAQSRRHSHGEGDDGPLEADRRYFRLLHQTNQLIPYLLEHLLSERVFTPISYIVLGLLDQAPGTPYDLKARVASGLGNFWSVQHAQLYSETERLASEGLLSESREQEGRRRKTYAITESGKLVLEDWLAIPAQGIPELREPSMLKIYFGTDPATVAPEQLKAHRKKLAEFEEMQERFKKLDSFPRGILLTLEAGIGHEREFVRYWSLLV